MKVTVMVGPGHHDSFLVGALSRGGILHRTIRGWPHFLVEAWGPDDDAPRLVARALWYHPFQRLTWALWRRLPRVGRYETPRALFCALFDLLARQYIDRCDLFVGWSQVSLRSMRRARHLGAVTLLEHPMSHVDTWMQLVKEEYARWGKGVDGYYSLFPASLVRRMKREYEAASYISVHSSFAKRTFLEAGVPEAKLIQIPLGVDPERFHPGLPNEGPFRILYVGRLELLKGVQYLLQACMELRLPDAELWLVGPVLREIHPVVARLGGERVSIVGEVRHEHLPAYYRRADVLVFPSVNDNFPLVILEAMATGLPVIATENTGGLDVVRDGVDGFHIPIRNPKALKERLLWLYEHREVCREMGMEARKRVEANFTWDHYAERIAHRYAALLRNRGLR